MSDLVPPSPPQDEATIPMASLAYALPTTAQARARPGLVTALGALDIVVGSLGLIASLATIAFAVTFYVAAKAADADIASRAAPSAPPAFLAPIGIAPAKIEAAPDGLADWPRRIAVEAVTSVHPLPPQRQEQLHAGLARACKKRLAVRDGASITSD